MLLLNEYSHHSKRFLAADIVRTKKFSRILLLMFGKFFFYYRQALGRFTRTKNTSEMQYSWNIWDIIKNFYVLSLSLSLHGIFHSQFIEQKLNNPFSQFVFMDESNMRCQSSRLMSERRCVPQTKRKISQIPDWIASEVFLKYVFADFNPWQMFNDHWEKCWPKRIICVHNFFFLFRVIVNGSR